MLHHKLPAEPNCSHSTRQSIHSRQLKSNFHSIRLAPDCELGEQGRRATFSWPKPHATEAERPCAYDAVRARPLCTDRSAALRPQWLSSARARSPELGAAGGHGSNKGLTGRSVQEGTAVEVQRPSGAPRGKQCRRGLGTGPVSMLLGQDWALSPGQLARTGPGLGLSAWGAGQTPVGLSPQSPSENLLQPLKSSVLGDSGEKNRPSARHFLEIFRENGSNTHCQPQCEWSGGGPITRHSTPADPIIDDFGRFCALFWWTWPRTGH